MPPIQAPSGVGYGGVQATQPAAVTIPDPVRGTQAAQHPPPYQAAAEVGVLVSLRELKLGCRGGLTMADLFVATFVAWVA